MKELENGNPIDGFLKFIDKQRGASRLTKVSQNPFIGKDEFNGKIIKVDGVLIAIDHWNPDADLIFISHAHMDHVPNIPETDLERLRSGRLPTGFICSKITKEIAKLRKHGKFDFPDENWILGQELIASQSREINGLTLTMIENGHTYGSTSLYIEGSETIFYTGDFTTEDRIFSGKKTPLKGLSPKDCEHLVMECTYGMPEFVFPPFGEISNRLNNLCSQALKDETPVILLAYAFGKSQVLLNALEFEGRILLERSIAKNVEVLKELGLRFTPWEPYGNYDKRRLKKMSDYALILPPYLMFQEPYKTLIAAGAKVVVLSGKVLNYEYRTEFPGDLYVPYSDHCDFNQLTHFIRDTGAKRLYLEHGMVSELSHVLHKSNIHPVILDN